MPGWSGQVVLEVPRDSDHRFKLRQEDSRPVWGSVRSSLPGLLRREV